MRPPATEAYEIYFALLGCRGTQLHPMFFPQHFGPTAMLKERPELPMEAQTRALGGTVAPPPVDFSPFTDTLSTVSRSTGLQAAGPRASTPLSLVWTKQGEIASRAHSASPSTATEPARDVPIQNDSVLNSGTSAKLYPLTPRQQHAALTQANRDQPGSQQTVCVRDIPLQNIVGMDRSGPGIIIEFQAFGLIPDGSVLFDLESKEAQSLPSLVHPRATVFSIRGLRNAADPAAYLTHLERDLERIANVPSLHGVDYLGPLEKRLEANLASGLVFEKQLGFMDYPHYEVAKVRWSEAIDSWLATDPVGRLVRPHCEASAIGEAMLQRHRDKCRQQRSADISTGILHRLEEWPFSLVAGALLESAKTSDVASVAHTVRVTAKGLRM